MTPSDWHAFKDDRHRMPWIAVLAIPLSRTIELLPLVPLDRLEKLSDPATYFDVTAASMVATYFGVKAWLQVRKTD